MISIEPYPGVPIEEQGLEIVERKGKGHPDSLCDSMMDAVSVALSQAYLREFGTILHHNIDKGLLAAGSVNRKFGGGEVVRPMELVIGDRATHAVGERTLPIEEIAIEAARTWLATNMRHVDPYRNVSYRVLLAPGSEELTNIFAQSGTKPANDTSATVGYYPLSPTEKIVLELEHYLNSEEFKTEHPETGEDVKIMALRRGKDLDLTVAMPLLCSHVSSEKEYFVRKSLLLRRMTAFVQGLAGTGSARIHYNALDEQGKGMNGVYLTLTGTSAEDADSGQVGRGNRVNGIIAVNRPLGTEAAAGKNPVSHVGKIYNLLAHRIAERLYNEIAGVREVYVYLVSRIGAPIDRPEVAAAQILPRAGQQLKDISRAAGDIIRRELSGLDAFCKALAEGRYALH